jgi:hypothetical protein
MRTARLMVAAAICAGCASGPRAASPEWIEAVAGDHLFWQSDEAVRHLPPGAKKPIELGKECRPNRMNAHSAADGSVYCMDGVSTIWRSDAASQRMSELQTDFGGLWAIAASGGRVYFASNNYGIGVVEVATGRARLLVPSVRGHTLAADGDVVAWLDDRGSLWSMNVGDAAPSQLDTIAACGVFVGACEIAIDHDAIYLAYERTCEVHDRDCPRDPAASVHRRRRSGGSWTTLAAHMRSAYRLRLDGRFLYWLDGGSIVRIPKSGGAQRRVETPGGISAYAIGEHDLFWFGECDGRRRSCRLERAPK